MKRRGSVLSVLSMVVALSAGCGARTGLLVDDGERPDAGGGDDADLHGDFPCNYSRVGELEPLLPTVEDPTTDPDVTWGDDHLGVAFSFAAPIPRAGSCTTDAELEWACTTSDDPGALGPGSPRIAWDGEAFGVCWANRPALAIAQLQRYSSSGSALWPDPVIVSESRGPCRELVWAGDRYLVALSAIDDLVNPETRVFSMDRNGDISSEELSVPSYRTQEAPFALAADGEVGVAAWVANEGLRVRTIRGMPESEIAFLVWPEANHLALTLRDTQAGVVWAIDREGVFRVFLTLVDLDTGGASDPIEVGRDEGVLAGVDVVGVGEGYVVAWSQLFRDRHRVVVVPTRSHEGPTAEVRGDLIISETPVPPSPASARPSLTYNGLDVFIAVTITDETGSPPQVHVQRLACHR